MRKNKLFKFTVIAVCVILVGLLGYKLLHKKSNATDAMAQGMIPFKVRQGVIIDTVSANGSVEAVKRAELKAPANGTVRKLNFAEGDKVKAGDIIAVIESTDLEQRYSQAVQDLKAARSKYDQALLYNGIQPSQNSSQLEQAQANLASAQAKLAELVSGAKPQEISQAQSAVNEAKANLDNATNDLKRMQDLYKDKIITKQQLESAELKATTAKEQYATSKAKLDLLKAGPTKEDLASAKAQVKQAQAAVNAAKANMGQVKVKEADIDTAKAQLAQAEENLSFARKQLDDLKIKATFDGVISSLPVIVGDQVNNSTVIAAIATDGLQIRVSVDETDIARVKEGQRVQIKLDAYPDKMVFGSVEKIAPEGVTEDNVVTYQVLIKVGNGGGKKDFWKKRFGNGQFKGQQPNLKDMEKRREARKQFIIKESDLKAGMTADVEIVVDQKQDVLILPTMAIKEGRNGKYVFVNKNGKQVMQTIQTGISTINDTEILGGLKDGQEVYVMQQQGSGFGDGQSNRGGPLGGGHGGMRRF